MHPPSEQTKPLTIEEETELFERWRKTKDRRAKDRIILSVYRTILAEANYYTDQKREREDLIQCGMIGALKAFDRFDAVKSRFNTYALWWIRAEMLKYCASQATLLSGARVRSSASEATQIAQKMATQTAMVAIDTRRSVAYDQWWEMAIHRGYYLVHPFLVTESTEDEKVLEDERKELLYGVLLKANLTPNELWVVHNRWLGSTQLTLTELGNKKNRTRERMRQIEASAFQKILQTIADEGVEEELRSC